ncbi:ABC1 kinase family protein [Paraburkholderia flava]|uniref:ABC1 kinase family protein n=1 Tax=Paraburkholderia flava TaxID=2547393 RepID=UPI001060F94D|nr:AarF/UbiB family protein [Paraburkholderia flava]
MPSLFRRLVLLFHLLRYGARLLWRAAPRDHKLHWIATLVSRMHEAGSPAGLQRALPQLGPIAAAFAQSLAEHPELAAGTLHDAFDAVAHLEEPLPPQAVEFSLAAAFGRPLSAVFESIDLVPAQNGFAEQIHTARLAVSATEPAGSHRDVSIKLVRTAQLRQLGDDAALLRWAARWIERVSGAARSLQVRSLANAFCDDLLRRFDLRAEAANLSQTGHHFAGDDRLVIPDVIWDLCTDHTLALRHVESLPAIDLTGLAEHRVNLARLATHLVEVVAQQAFEHGFFHAALDARRVRVSIEPDTLGRIVLADFARMSSLSSDERAFFVHGATALFEQDYGRLADLHREAGHVPHTTRTEMLEAELRTRSEAHFALHPHERSAGELFHHLLHAVQPFDGGVSPRLAAAQRAFEEAEALARTLHPGVNTWHIARTVLADIARRDLGHRGWLRRLSHELPHLAQTMPRIPQLAARYLQQQHDRHASRQQRQLLADIGREYRRTRILLWACAICGGVLGAWAMLAVR